MPDHRLPLRRLERRRQHGQPATDLNVTADVSVTASFAIDTLHAHLRRRRPRHASAATPTDASTYGGDGTAVTAVPAAGYHFVKWSDDVRPPAATDPNVTADISVTASFAIDTFTLTYAAGAHGTISGDRPRPSTTAPTAPP